MDLAWLLFQDAADLPHACLVYASQLLTKASLTCSLLSSQTSAGGDDQLQLTADGLMSSANHKKSEDPSKIAASNGKVLRFDITSGAEGLGELARRCLSTLVRPMPFLPLGPESNIM
jgi:hypothetical protein